MQPHNTTAGQITLSVTLLLMSVISSVKADENRTAETYYEQILLDRPIAYYRFEETSGNEVTDHADQPEGSQRGAQHGIRHGTTVVDKGVLAIGKQPTNRAAKFDGIDDRVEVRLPPQQDVLQLAGSFTIELWVRPGTKPSYQQLLAKGDYYRKGQTTFFLLCMSSHSGSNNTRSLRVGIGNGQPPNEAFDAKTELPIDVWSHVAVTYDARNSQTKLYVNGRLDTQGRFSNAPPTFAGHALTIGALSGDPATDTLVNYFHGQLDEIAIYGHLLKPLQLSRHYALATGQAIPEPKHPHFEQDIYPLLAAACFDCHGADNQEQGLDLRTVSSMLQGGESGPVIERGNPTASLLLSLIESGQMPPDNDQPLSAESIDQIRRWIEAGAPATEKVQAPTFRQLVNDQDRQHWSFQKAVKPEIRSLDPTTDRVRTPIDALALNRLREKGLDFSPDANRLTLLRRAYFDLIGLPPSPEVVAAFLADEAPQAYRNMIDHLLESRHYGERWGRHWLDVVGYSDTGEIDNDLMTVVKNVGVWQYRDWVIRAINADMPYDQFISMQLAGDEMIDWRTAETFTPEIRDHLIATGFASHVQDHTDHDQYGRKERFDVLTQIMETFSSGILGVTMACAQCHDHKYEPFPQRDYYRLMACFMPAFNPDNWVRRSARQLSTISPAEKATVDQKNSEIDVQVASLTEKIKALETSISNETAPSNEPASSEIIKLRQQIKAIQAGRQSYGTFPAMWDVGPVPDTFLLRRGAHDQRGARLQPGFPAALSDVENGLVTAQRAVQTQGQSTGLRLALAKWLTQPDSRAAGLVARVLANHVWTHHFGNGIVTTPGNLGRTGSPPTHPEILNWLAADFIEHGWSRKRLHRQIMLSTVYRQQSQRSSAGQPLGGEASDPENRLLWRQNLRRLEAESVRDSILAMSGKLDLTAGGPAIMLNSQPNGMSTVKGDGSPTSKWRRSIYVFARRNYPLKFLEVFDTPIVPLNCTHRSHSTTVLQSLTLLNDPFLIEHAGYICELVTQSADLKNFHQIIEAAYVRILNRPPNAVERDRCEQYLAKQVDLYRNARESDDRREDTHLAVADLCHMLMCANDFLYLQ